MSRTVRADLAVNIIPEGSLTVKCGGSFIVGQGRLSISMDIFFADDARQDNPSRPGMGPLVGAGGIYVPSSAVSELEKAIDALCVEAGFPAQEEFKWSPGRELWMRDNLIGEERKAFLIRVLDLVRDGGGKAIVVVEDRDHNTATGVSDEIVSSAVVSKRYQVGRTM